MGLVEVLSGEGEPSALGAIEPPTLGAVDSRAEPVLGGVRADPLSKTARRSGSRDG